MNKLVELSASHNSGINDYGIKNLNLIKMNLCANKKITNVNHMDKLTELNACFKCGISNEGIKNLNLIILKAYGNEKITYHI
jgi:hypothetical protein